MASPILNAAIDNETDPCRESLIRLRDLVIDALGECCRTCGAHADLVDDTDECPDCHRERSQREGEMRQDAVLDEADRRMRIMREEA